MLKENEAKEWEYKMEMKSLQDRISQFERENSRLGQINAETVSRLRLLEDELDKSEKRRNELKEDAEETIKLYFGEHFWRVVEFLFINLHFCKDGRTKLKGWKNHSRIVECNSRV